MLRSFTVKNFRGFGELKIEPLARINLIAGKNDVGKTGVLEALYILFSDIRQFFQFPSAFRNSQERTSGSPNEQELKDNYASFWRWLPHQNESVGRIQIAASDDEQNPDAIESTVKSKNDAFPTLYEVQLDESNKAPFHDLVFHYRLNGAEVFSRTAAAGSFVAPGRTKGLLPLKVCSTRHPQPTEDANLFNSLVLKKKKQKLIASLKVIEPRLEDLQYLKVGSEPLVYIDVGLKELIPLTQMGQGFARLFRVFSEMLVEEAKLILIDEIENGIHHIALADIWKGIAEIATKENLQIFTTTHSWECIQAAHKIFQTNSQDFRLHRLEQVNGEIKAITYDEEAIDAALRFEMEVR